MEYNTNLNAIWGKFRNPDVMLELKRISQKAAKWVVESNHDLSGFSREIQMVPKYLELATHNGKNRFNPFEITEVTAAVMMYKSKIPVTDLIKQLLNIGTEKGEPLSAKEMRDFFATTALMNNDEQLQVIKFMRAIKENPVNSKKDFTNNNVNKPDLIQHKAYTSKFMTEPGSTSNFINLNNMQFIYGITRCKKPETLAKIVQTVPPSWGVSAIPNDLVKLYEMSNGNMDLIQDLLRGFHPWEIDVIVLKLSKHNTADLSKYKSHTFSTDYVTTTFSTPGIETSRAAILCDLGLSGRMELPSLDYYDHNKIKIFDGSFEQGKRR